MCLKANFFWREVQQTLSNIHNTRHHYNNLTQVPHNFSSGYHLVAATACLIKSPFVIFKISCPTPALYREYIYSKSKKTVTSENISGWGDESTRCEKSSLHAVTFIDLRFYGLLACPNLLCDWSEFNKEFNHFSGVHSFF